MTLMQIAWISLSGSYPVKVSSLLDFEVQSRDMIRILSHAEIFSFAALKCLQSGNMDSRVCMEPLNPCLWHSWTPCPWPLLQTLGLQQMRREAAIESASKALLLQRQRESFVLLHVPLSYCLTGRLVPFTRRMGLSSTNSLSKRPLLIRLSLTRLLLLPESLGLNLARIRLSLRRLLLIRLTSLTLVFY